MKNHKSDMYCHEVQYYETDMMKIVHHSNYIRWFEESRTYMLEKLGYPYSRIESEGILIPVLSVSCEYKVPCTYGEKVYIIPKLVAYTGIRMTLRYEVWNEDMTELRTVGESSHCFVDSEFRPMIPRKSNKELDNVLKEALDAEEFY